jgi:hypothetical protein
LALIAAVDYTELGNALFDTAPIGVAAWLVVVPFAMGMLIFEEARKATVRWRARSVAWPGAHGIAADVGRRP